MRRPCRQRKNAGSGSRCRAWQCRQRGMPETDAARAHAAEVEAAERIRKAESRQEILSQQYLGSPVKPEDLTAGMYEYGKICRWAVERCYIDLNGSLTTCCYDVSHRYGNLKEQSFREIWNGPLYRKLRREMVKGRLPGGAGIASG